MATKNHTLAPLAALTSISVKWKWKPKHQIVFDTMKKIMAKETLMAYPDFIKPFIIYTDASKVHL